jgi:hypothetical protein
MTWTKRRRIERRDWGEMRIEIVNTPEIKKRNIVGVIQSEDKEENYVVYE